MELINLGSNQTVIIFDDGSEVFFSYSTPVAAKMSDGCYVKTDKFHSKTTSRHINNWLDGAAALPLTQSFFDKWSK